MECEKIKETAFPDRGGIVGASRGRKRRSRIPRFRDELARAGEGRKGPSGAPGPGRNIRTLSCRNPRGEGGAATARRGDPRPAQSGPGDKGSQSGLAGGVDGGNEGPPARAASGAHGVGTPGLLGRRAEGRSRKVGRACAGDPTWRTHGLIPKTSAHLELLHPVPTCAPKARAPPGVRTPAASR